MFHNAMAGECVKHTGLQLIYKKGVSTVQRYKNVSVTRGRWVYNFQN